MRRMLTTLLLSGLFATSAMADDAVVGNWTEGPMELTVDRDGHFDWTVGSNVTDGRWTADASLVSMETDSGQVIYAYRIEGDTLTLSAPSGTQVVMQRSERKKRKKRR